MATVRGLALLAALVLAGCGGSGPKPRGGPVLKLGLPLLPQTLDPARAADLPSLNVAHELYAGLARFSPSGVEPDLAESWEVEQDGLVWTFHLREGLRWSDDRPITAHDFRRSWLRALAPATGAAYAGPALGIVRGARRFHASGNGSVGIEALDERTLRVSLQHPVPWFDQLAAFPVAAAYPDRPKVFSGPFRLVSRGPARLVLERNADYWRASAVKPRRLVLGASTTGADAVLPRSLAGPGLPWIDTVPPAPPGAHGLASLATGLLWFVTRGTPLSDPEARQFVAWVVTHIDLGTPAATLVPPEMPGAAVVNSRKPVQLRSARGLRLTLTYAKQDVGGSRVVEGLRRNTATLRSYGLQLTYRAVATRDELLELAGPPAKPGVDLFLLGWSSKIFDAYNILDLFPCGSAFNVAQWCDHSYDRLMARAVRERDDEARWRLERQLVEKLHDAVPAIPVYAASDHFSVAPGVEGFSWSPLGFYELMGMTRS